MIAIYIVKGNQFLVNLILYRLKIKRNFRLNV